MARGIAGSYGVRTERNPKRYVGRDPEPPPEWDYHEIGDTGRYTAPGGLMTVGFVQRPTSGPPQSEQPGRGVFAPSWEERFLASNPTQQPDQYGAFPEQMNQIINSTQFMAS
jgi:hypothetical protein